MIYILIADDHPVIREGIKHIVNDAVGIVIAGEAGTGEEVLDLIKKHNYNMLLLDINLPGINGIDILRKLRKEKPELPVLILSVYPEDQYAASVLRAGAAGYICKDSASLSLVDAIYKVAAGGKYISPGFAQKYTVENLKENGHSEDILSCQELTILRLIASGKEKKTIAKELCLSPQSVSTYRVRILRKLELSSDAQIVRYALANHLVE
jgi:two-component system, NarL family, invasion response regulator UvrY